MNPNFNIGPITFHIYGLVIALAVYIGWLLAKKRSKQYKIPENFFEETKILIVLFLALVFARAYHVFSSFSYYLRNPGQIIAVWNGGIGIIGGLIGLFLGLAIATKFNKKFFLSTLDLISPSILLAQAIGRIGNYFNKEGFGPPTNMPWGVYIDPANRPVQYFIYSHFHPTFFYEAAIDFVFFAILIALASKYKKPGQVFGIYLMMYSLGRFMVEFWRLDTWTIGVIKVAHVITILFFLSGLFLFRRTKVRS